MFVAEFTAEWNRLQASAGAGLAAKRSELAEVRRRIDGMIRAIEEGLYEPSMKARMQGLERRREALEAELAAAAEPKPRLHPGLAEVYRQKVAALHEALAAEDGARGARGDPGAGRGDRAGAGGRQAGDRGPRRSGGDPGPGPERKHPAGRAGSHADLLVQVKLVAGAGFEPATFRL